MGLSIIVRTGEFLLMSSLLQDGVSEKGQEGGHLEGRWGEGLSVDLPSMETPCHTIISLYFEDSVVSWCGHTAYPVSI